MNSTRRLSALAIALSLILVAGAQTASATPVPESLSALQHDLRTAAEEMGPCPPIYEGHCGKSKSAVHEARVIVDALITAARTEASHAAASKAPASHNSAPSEKKPAPQKETTKSPTEAAATQTPEERAQLIAASQDRLRKAIEAIQQAEKDFKATSASFSAEQSGKLDKALETAEAEASKAFSLHAPQL